MKRRSSRSARTNGSPTKAELAAEIAALRKRHASLERRAARAGKLASALRESEERYRGAEAEAIRLAEIWN